MKIDPDKSRHPTVTAEGIFGFFDEFRWLSNFHKSDLTLFGITYPSSENAYQALKTHDQPTRLYIAGLSPSGAKKASHSLEIRADWEYVRVAAMQLCLIEKFRDVELRKKLLLTDGYYLEETNNWGDIFWGVCEGAGKNMLGQLLMLTRDYYK